MIVAILIGREKSKGFPGKNLHNILGHPLSYYAMKAANDCREIDKAYISTDDERLMELAKKNGFEVIVRPQDLCTDEAKAEDVFIHAYKTVQELNKGIEIEIIVLLMCNAPTITEKILSEGIKVLRENPGYDSAVTVSKYNMWGPLRARKIGKDGLLHPFVPFESFGNPQKLNCDRDSQGDVWFADMGASIIRPKCLENIKKGLLPQKWMGQKIMKIFSRKTFAFFSSY